MANQSSSVTKTRRLWAASTRGPLTSQGTQLFPSYPWGIGYTSVIVCEPPNDSLWNDWIRIFLKKDRDFKASTVTTLDQFNELFALSASEYGGIIGTDVTDLSAIREKGHKLLAYHGTADTYIPVDAPGRYPGSRRRRQSRTR
jgi:hypothetical protein